ncbi:hypothetical protein [Woeseia oceani]|uniref:DUF4136 domain-containing protein n=1 Tax=Woeseia oceani TaxID=1548547 RepID=A0A193LDS8_9GAMM|nr:hypothetical protein [Woeseia oceani]ANO50685.1 hypothetical protein BA177_05210 [Woeseia oceani]
MAKYRFLIIAVVLAAGCASTELSSYIDPEYVDRSFNSVVVWSDWPEIEGREILETILAEEIRAVTQASVVRSIDVAPPTRQFSSDEIVAVFLGQGINGAITIQLSDSQVLSKGGFNMFGFGTSAVQIGAARINLVDIETGIIAWTGLASVSGNRYATVEMARRSAAKEIASELANLGLLPRVQN